MVIHDWLYCQNKLNREKCDALFMTCCWHWCGSAPRAGDVLGAAHGGWYRYSQRAGGVKVEHVALN